MLTRRTLFGGMLATLAAPAIIRTPGLLMPVKQWDMLRPAPLLGETSIITLYGTCTGASVILPDTPAVVANNGDNPVQFYFEGQIRGVIAPHGRYFHNLA